MNIKKIIGIGTLIAISACSDPAIVCGCFQPTNIEMAFSYQDQQGNDLLNPEYEYSINKDNLDIYYREDGRYKRQLNFSDSFQIIHKQGQKNLLLFKLSSTPFEDREASLLLNFPHTSSDTLDLQAKGSNDELFVDKIWYNGELLWSNKEGEDPNRYFEITKTVKAD